MSIDAAAVDALRPLACRPRCSACTQHAQRLLGHCCDREGWPASHPLCPFQTAKGFERPVKQVPRRHATHLASLSLAAPDSCTCPPSHLSCLPPEGKQVKQGLGATDACQGAPSRCSVAHTCVFVLDGVASGGKCASAAHPAPWTRFKCSPGVVLQAPFTTVK